MASSPTIRSARRRQRRLWIPWAPCGRDETPPGQIRFQPIVEQGTHSQLAAAGGYYAELAQKQMLEEELEAI